MAPADHLPLHRAFPWQPFRLDALGLVTLLGAEEVSRAIGGLQHSTITEYLPLMGAYLIAANRFTDPLPGYKAYNITDGIIPPALNGAFTRWLDNHIYSSSRRDSSITTITWTLAPEQDLATSWRRRCPPLMISILLNSILLVICILLADWYGIANTVGMILSVVVRWFLLRQNRLKLKEYAEKAREKFNAQNPNPEDLQEKILLVEPPSSTKLIVNKFPKALLFCFIFPLASSHQQSYRFARLVGWLAFSIHVICIGQSSLIAQLMSVGLLIAGTVGAIFRMGCDESEFGGLLKATSTSSPPEQQRRDCFAELDPTPDEERALEAWFLLPLRGVSATNTFYTAYEKKKPAHPAAIIQQAASKTQ
ncbi:hypothetical protein LTR84_003072 [Exophiala bonariae]|uniref:Uncharacterized protein n=1 Tax=Exophiala bonariae TaxID=1690606 RepID=A0AAV9NCD5_9EURO|nr:hypothetical protein LTR84_003072 [Exophiala bonariae]